MLRAVGPYVDRGRARTISRSALQSNGISRGAAHEAGLLVAGNLHSTTSPRWFPRSRNRPSARTFRRSVRPRPRLRRRSRARASAAHRSRCARPTNAETVWLLCRHTLDGSSRVARREGVRNRTSRGACHARARSSSGIGAQLRLRWRVQSFRQQRLSGQNGKVASRHQRLRLSHVPSGSRRCNCGAVTGQTR